MAGLSSLSKNINIKGQPHSLAYINKAEAALLKARGGSGRPTKETNGIPSYEEGEGEGDDIGGWDDIGNTAGDPDAPGFGDDLPGMDPTDDPSPPGRNPTEAEFDALGLFDDPDKGALGDFYSMTPQTIDLMAHPAEDPEAAQNRWNTKKTPKHLLPKYTLEMLQDPVLQAAKTNPELKQWYDDAIKVAAQSMSSNQVLGVMGQSGYRDGSGYISSLERGGFDRTWGLGIRGENEVQGPEGMTEAQYNNYIDLYMAFDETRAGNLRRELDAVPKDSPETVGSIFEEAGVNPSIYGLDPKMNANKVAGYMDMKALEGIVQGIPMFASIVTGSVSPLMMGDIFGAGAAFKEGINEAKSWFSGTVLEPTVEEIDALGVELKENAMSVVPENIDIAARIGELFGVRNQDYFDKEGFYNRPEPTVESLMTEEENAKFNEAGSVMSAYEAYLEPPAVPEDVRRDVERIPLPPLQTLSKAETEELMRMMNRGLSAQARVGAT